MSRWWGHVPHSNQLVVDAGQLVSWSAGQLVLVVLMAEGARAVISFRTWSSIPVHMLVPPDMTVLADRSFLMSTSPFMMEF